MNHPLCLIMLLLTIASSSFAASGKTVTFYSDGAQIETEAAASRGMIEINLPGAMIDNSLRIAPMGNSVIERVEIIAPRLDSKSAKEIEQLIEQKSRLQDRLQALETREDIFKAAAKSQSAKAPRKTKTNPDPMQSIRQGTEFAIAQLEAVYTTKRKAEQEVRRLDARINALKRGGTGGEAVARVSVSPVNGRVKVRYALDGYGWTPRYDLRLNNDGNALLTLFGQLPNGFAGYLLQAAPASLAGGGGAQIMPVQSGSLARLAEHRLPVRDENFADGIRAAFSFVLTNSGKEYLPTGDGALYRSGEYRGRFRFAGISSARSRKVASGM